MILIVNKNIHRGIPPLLFVVLYESVYIKLLITPDVRYNC